MVHKKITGMSFDWSLMQLCMIRLKQGWGLIAFSLLLEIVHIPAKLSFEHQVGFGCYILYQFIT